MLGWIRPRMIRLRAHHHPPITNATSIGVATSAALRSSPDASHAERTAISAMTGMSMSASPLVRRATPRAAPDQTKYRIARSLSPSPLIAKYVAAAHATTRRLSLFTKPPLLVKYGTRRTAAPPTRPATREEVTRRAIPTTKGIEHASMSADIDRMIICAWSQRSSSPPAAHTTAATAP